MYQLNKFFRRHQIAFVTTALVAAAILFGLIISLWQANRAYRAMLLADQSLSNEKEALAHALKSESILKRQLYASETAEAWNALNGGDRKQARILLDRAKPEVGKPDFREFSWNFANSLWNSFPKEFVGHEAGILTASMSPDNRWIVSGDRVGTIKIWSLETGREIASWNYSDKEITTAVFSPDGKTLATAGQDSTVRLWNTSNWEASFCFRGHSLTVCSLGWSPDGNLLASGSRDHSVRIWDVTTGMESKCLDGMEEVIRKVLWTSDGNRLIVADGRVIRSWNTEDWQELNGHQGHTQGVLAMAISPDGSLLVTGGYDKHVIVYSLATHELLTRANTGASVWSLTFSPDGKYLVSGMFDGGPMVWRISAKGSELEVVRGGLEGGSIVRAIEFTKDQTKLMVASEEDKTIRLWKSKSVFGHEYVYFPEDCMDVDTGTDLAVNRGLDGSILLRSLTTGELRNVLAGHSQTVTQSALSRSNNWLATYANDNEVLLWDLRSHTLRNRLTFVDNLLSEAPAKVQLEFSADERLIAASGELPFAGASSSVRIWNVADGTLFRDLCYDQPNGTHIGFSPRSDQIAVGGMGRFAIFPLDSQKQQSDSNRTGGHIWQIQYTPDGTQLVTSGDNQGAMVWDAATFQNQSQFARHRSVLEGFSISPDGRTLATAGADQTLRLWHFPSGQLLCTLLRHSNLLNWVRFASNTKLLLGTRLDDESTQGVFVFNAGE